MITAPISEQDWDWLAGELGRAQAALHVWQRIASEQAAEIQDLRGRLAAQAEQLDKPPGEEG